MSKYLKYLYFIALVFSAISVQSQGFQTNFGKNVVQYKDFKWSYYQSPNFDVYFYEGGKEPARFVIENAEKSIREVEKLLNYPISDKLIFVVYNSYTDFRQSNFRLSEEAYNTGGRSPIIGNRIFIYFDGNHFDFVNQIRAGIARITFNELIVGSNFQERIQNNVLLNIPEWFIEGFIQHTSLQWNGETESRFLSKVAKGKYDKFKKLSNSEQIEVGYALWNYLYSEYGESQVSDLLFNTRLYRSTDEAMKVTFNKNFMTIYEDWLNSYKKKIANTKGESPIIGGQEYDLKNIDKKGIISKWSVSGNGVFAAFSIQKRGVSKVYIYDFKTGKRNRIFRQGYERKLDFADNNYPITAFNPLKNEVTIIYESKSVPYFETFNYEKKQFIRKEKIEGIQTVLDIDYHPNGRNLLVSAIKNGQTDLFIFEVRTGKFKALTNDIYDEIQPRFTENGKSIVFSSNAPDKYSRKINSNNDYKFSKDFNVYKFPDWQNIPNHLILLSKLNGNEIQADGYDSTYSTYLTDENGLQNLNASYSDSSFKYTAILALKKQDLGLEPDTFIFNSHDKKDFVLPDSITKSKDLLRIDTVYVFEDKINTFQISNFNAHLIGIKMLPKIKSQFELFNFGGNYHLIKRNFPKDISSSVVNRENNNFGNPNIKIDIVSKTSFEIKQQEENKLPDLPDSLKSKYSNYFVTGYENQKDSFQVLPKSNPLNVNIKEKRGLKFAPESIYKLTYYPELITSQVDNGMGNSNYQPYKAGENSFFSNQISGFFTLSMSDLLKDYKLTGGVRILYSLSGAEYFVKYENFKYKLDQKFLVYRRSERKGDEFGTYYKTVSLEGRYEVKYPFSEILALKGSVFIRNDQINFLSTDRYSLEKPNVNQIWQGGKLEFIFDNSNNRLLNAPTGIKAKAYSEIYYSLNTPKSTLYTLGMDARGYLPLGKYAIWANRMAIGTSLGSAKIVYFLGGVDGWLLPNYNSDNQVDASQNFIYKAQAMNMRGFNQNARNGNSYGVINSELRFPVFRMLFKRQLRSSFFNNFQFISFFDVGSAWNGFLPTGKNNAFNTKIIDNNPFYITVITKRDPFVYGFGYGIRTTFLGYYVRLDYGYGVEESARLPKVVYLSLGLDF